MAMRCDQYQISILVLDAETAAPPPPPSPSSAAAGDGAEHYISITVHCELSFRSTTGAPSTLLQASRQATALVPRGQFLADAQATLRRVVSDTDFELSGEAVESVARCLRRMSRSAIAENPSARVVPLQVSIAAVKFLRSRAEFDRLMAEHAAGVSEIPAINTVPAAKASVESLEHVTVEEIRDQDRCTICLEEFDDHDDRDDHDDDHHDCDQRAVRMPCSHIYHKDCIVQWLEKNHKCPLCRHAMPID